ncbi:hypothetical protein [Erwinia aphidicola]|jgi:hypothetical protein|uniref:hypothetical protein n=1 Tax=Erwinia aphidicola TaxID=68334 RepID=UPI00300D60AD
MSENYAAAYPIIRAQFSFSDRCNGAKKDFSGSGMATPQHSLFAGIVTAGKD